MHAYLCVYRHRTPNEREWRDTKAAAKHDPLLSIFLDSYQDSFYDWGDDPSFFAAHHLLGDVRRASWGVCRRDVRNSLCEGDLLVFICGAQNGPLWRYFYVGFGTVRALIGRVQLWTDPRYAEYRPFYNVLARIEGENLVQHETFHNYHDDWRKRAEAPYVLFDPETASST